MISLGVWPWADYAKTGNYINIAEGDKWNLERWGGGFPYLAYAWAPGLADWKKESWVWLASHGYRECVLRLFLDGTSSDSPCDPPAPEIALQSISEHMQEPVRHGIQLVGVQFDNEPDLERRHMNPQAYAAWCLQFIALWREKFPAYKLISPPLAQDSPNHEAWFNALKPVVEACDYVGLHYYFGRKPGDMDAGFPDSPEHIHKIFPSKPIIITECGNASTQENIGGVLRRWMATPYIRSFHVFVLNSEHFPQWNYNVHTGNVLNDLVREWRDTRAFPLNNTGDNPMTEPVNANGGITGSVYPDLWNQWVAAGGPENNFVAHLIGIGVVQPSLEQINLLASENIAKANQLARALISYHGR